MLERWRGLFSTGAVFEINAAAGKADDDRFGLFDIPFYEFLNGNLYPWCRREGIRLTRGRPYKKNDQAYVEQRNWTAVRRLVGYDRYGSRAAHAQFLRLYGLVTEYLNYFQPVRKRVGKERVDGRVRKRYDRAQTPYQRLLAADALDAATRADLAARYAALNPAHLRRQIDAALQVLWRLADHPVSNRYSEASPPLR